MNIGSYIKTRDKRISSLDYYHSNAISSLCSELVKHGTISVGGRASCGGKTDISWVIFTAWNEVVKKANLLGFKISSEKVKVGNQWATKNGGFWDENIYRMECPDASR